MLDKMISDLKKPDNRYRESRSGHGTIGWRRKSCAGRLGNRKRLGWVDIACMPEMSYGLPISEVNGCSTLKHVLMKAIRLVSNRGYMMNIAGLA